VLARFPGYRLSIRASEREREREREALTRLSLEDGKHRWARNVRPTRKQTSDVHSSNDFRPPHANGEQLRNRG